jgi:D-alanine-D-alanine ligase
LKLSIWEIGKLSASEKIRIGVIFGGRSGEHEVSLASARSVLAALDQTKYAVTQIGITPAGRWLTGPDVLGALSQGITTGLAACTLLPDPTRTGLYALQPVPDGERLVPLASLDVIFPVLHGTFGEDGTLQGLLELADTAYVGAGVVGSAVGMDKAIFKQVMAAQRIRVADWMLVLRSEIERDLAAVIDKVLGLAPFPLFVKPANLGSSVGITKCRTRSDLQEGLQEAAQFDRRLVVERGLQAREIEVSVLGNDQPEASLPGEIRPQADFYSYEAKYQDERSELLIPAPLPEAVTQQVQALAIQAYRAVDCAGMARVDFLLEEDTGELYINELNTIPGFTQISMYTKLWEASGLPYAAVLDRLIQLAQQRKQARTSTVYRM